MRYIVFYDKFMKKSIFRDIGKTIENMQRKKIRGKK